ncbi:MAG TPA: ABC transporter ATP-binding protein [Acidimicrobiales bacterium]
MSKELEISGLTVRYGSVVAVEGFDLTVPEGHLTVLLGASGCGKSTVLGTVAGTVTASAGRVRVGSTVVVDVERRRQLPPARRELGMVFQSYALWPHMTVLKNVAYPLARAKVPKAERRERALATLRTVQCEDLADRLPGELSGGQQQRIALARAIVAEPACILFDEPLSNLDAGLRRTLREEIRALQLRIGGTGLYVTHDQEEALGIADEVAVMRAGRIEQFGAPDVVYRRPVSAYVARFLGANLVPGTFEGYEGDVGWATTPFGRFGSTAAGDRTEGQPVLVGMHPESAAVRPDPSSTAVVDVVSFVGKRWEYVVGERGAGGAPTPGGPRAHAFSTTALAGVERGTPVALQVDPDAAWFFDADPAPDEADGDATGAPAELAAV